MGRFVHRKTYNRADSGYKTTHRYGGSTFPLKTAKILKIEKQKKLFKKKCEIKLLAIVYLDLFLEILRTFSTF